MIPLMQQCYDSALGARSLASSIKRGEVASLRLALSRSVDLAILIPYIDELRKHHKHLELKLIRGSVDDAAECLKQGTAELAIASSLGETWERLDKWPLYTESFQLIANTKHRLMGREVVTFDDLRDEPLIIRSYCEHAAPLADLCRSHDLGIEHAHELNSQSDLILFLERGFGVAFAPCSETLSGNLMRARVDGFDLQRTIFLYGVAGRQRTPVATLIMKMLRGANWSQFSALDLLPQRCK
jgi:DNA-binding transcriptional LysR family regulator